MEVEDDLHSLLLNETETAGFEDENVDVDFMVAFELQMQEVMNASEPSAVHRVPEEVLLKYEQEARDRHAAEAEMRKIEEDLNRRVHDLTFAREILAVPDDQWEKTGDHLHRPYGETSSSNVDCFRVYVKGLMGEDAEDVGGLAAGKHVAGIGVAVCDPSGILVFEVSKPLVQNDQILNDEVVELKALVEGLNVAVMLGLKRVNVLLDSQTILQYVSGILQPRKDDIAALVKQATFCLKKLMDCVPSLVTTLNTVNFAVRLATDAIVSQLRGPGEKTLRKSITETCTICLQETDIDQIFLINGCLHYYCFSCMNKHVEAKLLQGMLPECPQDRCTSKLKLHSCQKFLTPKLYDLMSERVKETTIPITEKIYCPNPRCSTLMSKADIHVSDQSINVVNEQVGPTMCSKCHLNFCINCRVPWHEDMTCFDYRRVNPYLCVDDAELNSLVTHCLWRQCKKCNHMVSLAEGCYHIYCRCGHEFCYTCGAEWKNKKATCSCPIWDERNIIYDGRGQPRGG